MLQIIPKLYSYKLIRHGGGGQGQEGNAQCASEIEGPQATFQHWTRPKCMDSVTWALSSLHDRATTRHTQKFLAGPDSGEGPSLLLNSLQSWTASFNVAVQVNSFTDPTSLKQLKLFQFSLHNTNWFNYDFFKLLVPSIQLSIQVGSHTVIMLNVKPFGSGFASRSVPVVSLRTAE